VIDTIIVQVPTIVNSMKTCVYIDGFNLYNGCLKTSEYKWMNLRRLAEVLLPADEVGAVKYFTAKVSGSPNDVDQPVRQQIYWRALSTVNVEIIEGMFYESTKSMPLHTTCRMHNGKEPTLVRVRKKEEKGSDVNLASHPLLDAFQKRYEQAAVVTNDSDLGTPISMVRDVFKLPVVVINPHEHHSKELKKWATKLARIRVSDLIEAQFEDELVDVKGPFHKPPSWNTARYEERKFSFLKGGLYRLK
jgi:hypothetical protein